MLLIAPMAEADALAGSLAAWLHAGLLAIGLARRSQLTLTGPFARDVARAVGATAVMVVLLLAMRPVLSGFHEALALGALVAAGGLAFRAAAFSVPSATGDGFTSA